jgi:uncharacterized protein (DUF2236 family)
VSSPSLVQRRATDVRLFGAGGYALALQLGHPTIAAGVRDHSTFTADPWGRFFGTVDFVNLLVYGRPDEVATATRNLRKMHARIRGVDAHGARYTALDPDAYAWVHATLAEAIVRGHHVFGVEFTAAQKQQLWDEWLELGGHMGVRGLPETWPAFQEYLRAMVADVLEYNDMIEVAQRTAANARGASPSIMVPAVVWTVAAKPLGRVGAFLARGTMGPTLRAKYRIEWSERDQWTFARLAAAHRAATPLMPPVLRRAGPTMLRVRAKRVHFGPFGAGAGVA